MNAICPNPHEGELTDSELDVILNNVHNELLAHAEDVAHPAKALVAMMADSAQVDPLSSEYSPTSRDQLTSERLTAVIQMRRRATEVHGRLSEVIGKARSLAIDLDREFTCHGDLSIAVMCALSFARHRDRHLVQLLSHARDLAIEIVHDLVHMRQLDHELALDRDIAVVRELWNDELNGKTFDNVRKLDRAVALNRQLAIDSYVHDACELAARLDSARRLSDLRERWLDLDRRTAHHLALAIDLVLVHARELSGEVTCRLDAFEIDAASADLSQLRIYDAKVLKGVIWTDATVWPPEIAEDVTVLSRELCRGIYQVRPDGQRHAVRLGRHATRRMPISSC